MSKLIKPNPYNINVGDRITISGCGYNRYPGKILSATKTKKTLIVGENKYKTDGMCLGTGPMIKSLPNENVNPDEFIRKTKFKWNQTRQSYVEEKGVAYGPFLTYRDWINLTLDYGL